MKTNRNSALTIIISLFSQILKSIYLGVFLLTVTDLSFKTVLILSILSYFIVVIIKVLNWLFTSYYLKEDIFYYKRGIFIKREEKIPLDKILGVDLEQSISQRIFALKTLKIDIGSSEEISDIAIILSNKKAINLRKILLRENIKIEKDFKSDTIYSLDTKDLIKFSLSKIGLIEVIISLIALIFFTKELNLKEKLSSVNIGVAIIILLSLIIIITILKAIKVSNEYFDFKIKKSGDLLEISSGFINKKVYSLNTKTVFSIKTTQNILSRINNKVTVSVSALGYQDNQESSAIIFPYIDIDSANNLINNLFEAFYICQEETFNIHKKYKLKYNYYNFGYNNKVVYLKGGILKRKTNLIAIDAIEDITFKQCYFNKKYNIYKLKLDYKNKKFTDMYSIKGVDISHINNLIDIVLKNDIM